MAVAPNQHPIIAPLYFGGATFETNDIPMGDNSSSANVSIRYTPISRLGETNVALTPSSGAVPSPAVAETRAIMPKATPATIMP